jgi:hypothetical protein
MVNPDTAPLRGTFYSNAFKDATAALAVEPITANVHSASDIETAILPIIFSPAKVRAEVSGESAAEMPSVGKHFEQST